MEGSGGVKGYDEEREKADGTWLRSWGGILGDNSQDALATNQWYLGPEEDGPDNPPDGLARLYYVARDRRVGVDWFFLQVQVEPGPP